MVRQKSHQVKESTKVEVIAADTREMRAVLEPVSLPEPKEGWIVRMSKWRKALSEWKFIFVLTLLAPTVWGQEAGAPRVESVCEVGPIQNGGRVTPGETSNIAIAIRGCGEVIGIRTTGESILFDKVVHEDNTVMARVVADEHATPTTRPLRFTFADGTVREASKAVSLVVSEANKKEQVVRAVEPVVSEAAPTPTDPNKDIADLRREMFARFAQFRKELAESNAHTPAPLPETAATPANNVLAVVATPEILGRLDAQESEIRVLKAQLNPLESKEEIQNLREEIQAERRRRLDLEKIVRQLAYFHERLAGIQERGGVLGFRKKPLDAWVANQAAKIKEGFLADEKEVKK